MKKYAKGNIQWAHRFQSKDQDKTQTLII